MKQLLEKNLDLVIKVLGWRLEFLKETPDLGTDMERKILEKIIEDAGYKTIADPESGEIILLKSK